MESNSFENQTNIVENKIAYEIDPLFANGELLYLDVVNAWPQRPERVEGLRKVPHYKQYYEEKGIRDVEAVRKSFGEKEAKEHKEYYPKALIRIMEMSDPDQITKYNNLVDEYNADIERIQADNDTEKLQYFLEKALSLIEEKK